MMTVKACRKCKRRLQIDKFGKLAISADGYNKYCLLCAAAQVREHYARNADAIKARGREYAAACPEKVRAAKKKYRDSNRDKEQARRNEWRAKNPQANARYVANRRAVRLEATPKWADIAKIKDLYDLAAHITQESGFRYHVDHIVPLQSEIVCGLHWEGNMQVIRASANISKGNRHWPDMP